MAFNILGLDLMAFSQEMSSPSLKYKKDVLMAYLECATKHKKQLQIMHHPDKGGDAQKFKLVQQAYEFMKQETDRIIDVLNYIIEQTSMKKVKIEIK